MDTAYIIGQDTGESLLIPSAVNTKRNCIPDRRRFLLIDI